MDMAVSEMEFSELAPGDPISQGGSLRAFRYSQFSECPSAPFNTAEPECLPPQFHLSASLADSPLLDHKYMPNGGRLGEPSSSLLCSHRNSDTLAEGVNCNPKCGEHLQPGSSISDSLKLSILDARSGSKERESSPRILEEAIYASDVGVSVLAQQDSPLHFPIQRSPRRIYCDRRLLEEETQVFDVGVSISKEQDSYLQSGTQHLQLAPQTTVAEVEKSLPVLAVKQGCHAPAEDFADICHRWHNGRGIAPAAIAILSSSPCMSLPPEAKHEVIKLSTSSALDVDHFRRQPTDLKPENPGPCATKQTTNSKAIEDDVGTVERCYSKRRISLAALNSLKLSTNIRSPIETKQEIIKPSTSDELDAGRFRGQPAVFEPDNASPSKSTNQKILTAVDGDVDIVQRWNYRKRIAVSAITNLSSSSDKKLKETPDKPVELGARLHSTELQDQLVKDPFLNGNENQSVPQRGYDTSCMDAISPMSGSETTIQDVNVNDDTDDCCDSKLRRKLNYPCAKDIKSFLQPVASPNKSTSNISSTNAGGISKEGHAEEKWTCRKKSGAGGRQRTMDAWIR